MTTFLLKLNCELHLGGAVPRPTEAAQWEGIRVMMPHPSRISGAQGSPVSDGDTLVVWAHEDPNFGSGLGLTAEGVAHDVVRGTDGTAATLRGVRLLKPHFQLRGRAETDTGSRVIDHLRRLRHLRTYELESEELAEFWRVVTDFIGRREALLSSVKTQYMTNEEKALELDQAQILDGFQRRFTKQEARPDQYKFRADLLRLYGKCLITNCRVETVLQAAHIIPFSESVSYRNSELHRTRQAIGRCPLPTHELFYRQDGVRIWFEH